MNLRYKYILKPSFFLLDIVLLLFSFYAAWFMRMGLPYMNTYQIPPLIFWSELKLVYGWILNISILVWAGLSYTMDLQHVARRKHPKSLTVYFLLPQFILIGFVLILVVFSNLDEIPRLFLAYYFLLEIFLFGIARLFRSIIVNKIRQKGYNKVQISIIGENLLLDKFSVWNKTHKEHGFYVKKSDVIKKRNSSETFMDYATRIVRSLSPGGYLIFKPDINLSDKDVNELIYLAEEKGARIFYVIDLPDYIDQRKMNNQLGPFNVVQIRLEPLLQEWAKILKRGFDFIISFLFIMFVYWWISLFIAFAIKIKSKGPAIFKQKRVGRDGKIFFCYKFRTMHHDKKRESGIGKISSEKDERIFEFGKLLRKTNLDELPQFINVLKGDMSIVGPRPHMISEDKIIAKKLNKYRLRYWVRPGITGMAAIKGYRGGTENMNLMQKRIDWDIRYIETWSFWLDIKICLQTILEMITGKVKAH